MKSVERIEEKLKESGVRGLSAAALRYAASHIDKQPRAKDGEEISEHLRRQLFAYRALSRYTSFQGREILEVGGAQSGHSAYPFLKDGAASVVVTGLDHISREQISDEHNLRVMRADALTLARVFGPNHFDVVYGLCIVEHIPSPEVFLDQVYTVLKPGGFAYFDGNPIWSSPKGHHLWVATWAGAYQGRATANYLFSEWPGEASTNPLPDWSHLLMLPDQMRQYLTDRSIPSTDIDCIIDWVFRSDQVNRINMSKIANAYTKSKLIVLEANTVRSDVPPDVQDALRKRCGDGVDYGISGVYYVLTKP